MELPRIEPIWKKYRNKGLSVIAINTYPETPGALEYFAEKGLTFPQILDHDKKYKEGVLELYGHPTTLVLDENGKIMFYELGFDEGDEVKLEQHVVELLRSPTQ